MGEQYPRLRIESNYYGKVIGISAPSIAKHDLDFICEVSSASAAERIVALWNAMRDIDDPATFVARVERLVTAAIAAKHYVLTTGYSLTCANDLNDATAALADLSTTSKPGSGA